MKKNMLPLLAIAFVVAIVSTGLFYGLFASKVSSSSSSLPKQHVVVAAHKLARGAVLGASDIHTAEFRGSTAFGNSFAKTDQVIGSTVLDPIEENQVLTGSVLASSGSSGGANVPTGMRAVTIHVFESGGVLALLRPGSHVDIQAVSDRNNAPAVSRTVLQNIEVLSTAALPEVVALHYSAPIATVLVRAEDVDLLAVADTGSRLRLALRNRSDEGVGSRLPVSVASLFSNMQQAVRPAVAGARIAGVRKPGERASAWARMVSLTDQGAREMAASLGESVDRSTSQIAEFRPQVDVEDLLDRMESHKDLVVLSSQNLTAELTVPLGRGFVIGGLSGDGRHLLTIVTRHKAHRGVTIAARALQD